MIILLASLFLSYASTTLAQVGPLPTYIPSENFTQRLFHGPNSTDTRTFNQSYQIDDSHFRPGGPILLFQHPEIDTPIATNNVSGIGFFPQYAADELGALRVCLEHRFFGTSYPEGHTGKTPAEFESLTLDNIIQDAVEFVKFLRKTVPGTEKSKLVVTGGSYGGFLAMMMKIREPDVFDGSIAMSPSFRGIGPLADNPLKFGFWTWINNMYYDVSTEASEKIKSAIHSFKACTDKGDCSSMTGLKFCGQQPNATELLQLYETLTDIFQFSAQFNYPIPITFPVAYPLQSIVNATLKAQTPGAVIQAPFALFLNNTNTSCLDWQNPGLTQFTNSLMTKSWSKILCSFTGNPDTSRIPEDGIFPAQNTHGRIDCPLSEEWWGPNYNRSSSWFQEHYKTRKEDLIKVERLLIVNGMQDPGSAYSERDLPLSTNRNHSRVINVSGMTHSEAQFPEFALPRGLKPSVDEARDIQVEYIKQWVGFVTDPERMK